MMESQASSSQDQSAQSLNKALHKMHEENQLLFKQLQTYQEGKSPASKQDFKQTQVKVVGGQAPQSKTVSGEEETTAMT